jgi:archaemetzincin
MLLRGILSILPDNTLKIIGIADFDLFVPVLTFVFGEAQLNGKAAIVSMTRLRNEFYGLPRNENILINRLVKEIVHELGHTFGLYHCSNFECVMKSSMYVENIDLKNKQFCETCREILSLKIIGIS